MPPLPQGVKSGRLTLSNSSPTRLSATPVPCTSVALRKLSGGTVYVGDSAVDTNGWPLDRATVFTAKDVRDVFVLGANGDVILWLATKAA